MIRFECPDCNKNLTVDDAKAGRLARCPGCGQKVRIPELEDEPEDYSLSRRAGGVSPPWASKPPVVLSPTGG